MIKKIKTIVLSLLFVALIGLSSCKKEIKELKISGEKMSQNEITECVEKYIKYVSDINEGKKRKDVSSNWYSFSSLLETKEESEDYSLSTYISMSGDFYDSFAIMDIKAHVKMNLDVEEIIKDDDKTQKGKVKANLSFVLVDGIWWIKGKMTSKIEGSQSIVAKIYKKAEYNRNNEISNAFPINDLEVEIGDMVVDALENLPFLNLKTGCIAEDISESFFRSVGYFDDIDSMYKTKKGYLLDLVNNDSKTADVIRSSIEFEKDSYTPKTYETYYQSKSNRNGNSEEYNENLKISKKLMGIINVPANKDKYGW